MHVVYRHYQADGRYVLKSFTGMITDKAGRKRYYVNGKPVKHEHYTGAGHIEHAHTKEQSHQAITAALTGKSSSHGELTELAGHLNNITVVELKKLRTQHGVGSVKNPTKEKLVNAFLDHVRGNVSKPAEAAKPAPAAKVASPKKSPKPAKESVPAKVDTGMSKTQSAKAPTMDEIVKLYDTISQPNVTEDQVQSMMDRLKGAKKSELKAIGDKIGMEFNPSDTAAKMQQKIAQRFLNVKRAAIKSTIFDKRSEKKDKPLTERDTPGFRNRKFDLEDKINGLSSDASDDLYQSLDDAETRADLDAIEAKIKAIKVRPASRTKPVAPAPPPAAKPEPPRREYTHNPNATGDPTSDEVAGLYDNLVRKDITEPQVQQVCDRIQKIKSKAALREIGQKIDMIFGASDTAKQMADRITKRLINVKRSHIKSTIFDMHKDKPEGKA